MIACYVRVSTQEQVNEGYSIQEQTDRLQKYADAMNWQVYKVYTDGGFSGANMNRPALQQMIVDIKNGFIDKVLVYKLDRLSRSQKDTLYLIEDVFLANNCDFVSMNENFDTSTPFGKAMIGILAVFAQLEREQIKERMQMGKDARAKLGLYHGYSNNPIGYVYQDGLLKINENEAGIVRKIFEMYAQGHSYASITNYLNNAGLYPYYGNPWSRKVIRHLIMSKVYIGMIPHRGQWLDGVHEPIISRELWDECERLRTKKADEKLRINPINGQASAYLTGLIYCKQCGARYSKLTKMRDLKKTGPTQYNKYYCNSRAKRTASLIKDPNCKNKIWNMEELDQIIFDEIEKLAVDPAYFEQSAQAPQKSNLRDQCLEQIAKLDKQISKIMDLYLIEEMPIESLQAKIHDLHQQKEKLEKMMEFEVHEQKALSKPVAWEKISSFKKILSEGNFDDIRAVLFMLIDKIELDNEDVTIFWNF